MNKLIDVLWYIYINFKLNLWKKKSWCWNCLFLVVWCEVVYCCGLPGLWFPAPGCAAPVSGVTDFCCFILSSTNTPDATNNNLPLKNTLVCSLLPSGHAFIIIACILIALFVFIGMFFDELIPKDFSFRCWSQVVWIIEYRSMIILCSFLNDFVCVFIWYLGHFQTLSARNDNIFLRNTK